MKLGNIIEFRKDLYFEGAVQADWFYNSERASKVAENFVFHSKQYFGSVDDGLERNKKIDTISLVEELALKLKDENTNPLSLVIAGYGTGKSHFAVTLANILSGHEFKPETYRKSISNISKLDKQAAENIQKITNDRNFVIVLNGMRDFNLNAEILKATQKSLHLYGLSDDKLKKLNRAIETAEMFFSRNSDSSIDLFEKVAMEKGWNDKGESLISKIGSNLMTNEEAFEIVNTVYKEINGQEISWDEGISATSILEMLISEYCGLNGSFDQVVILFDEFGRYLEYASGVSPAKSGESALQQIFEVAQNAEGTLHVVNFIQSDIKTYLQRVDQTKNISRYIGRYDASDKYYMSSNLETVFANLVYRKDKEAFNEYIVNWQNSNESYWIDVFEKLNDWLITKGMWKDYDLFRKIVIEGIYPMHPLSTYMLTHLQDYLQNRSSLMLISQYIEEVSNTEINSESILIMPEYLMKGDLFTEMLAAEQEGKQSSQHCISYNNIIAKQGDKLSEKSHMVLRSNLILRILRFRTKDYDGVKKALSLSSGLSVQEIEKELYWLENEYAVIGFDEHAGCFDFMEESYGAHDFRTKKKRLIASAKTDKSILYKMKIKEIAGISDNVSTGFGIKHNIFTNEWVFRQELHAIEDVSEMQINNYLNDWKDAINSTAEKGKLVWLYINKDTSSEYIEKIMELTKKVEQTPIIFLLLNDKENRLYNSLVEYDVLDTMDDSIIKKYETHYRADYQQAENNLKDEFSQLKKERLQIIKEGVKEINVRLSSFLSSVFEEIYPKAIPFWFDGFITANKNISRKSEGIYCTIIKMLLSNSVNEVTIHNYGSEERSRIEALLMTSTSTSWKCINENYNVVPPEEKYSRFVYEKIVGELRNNKKISCEEFFKEYCAPPYGMSEDIVMLMIAVISANLNYCLRFRHNNEVTSIKNWRDKVVVKDKKIDLKIVKQSDIIIIDTDAISAKYIILFNKIKANKNIYEVDNLIKSLEEMTYANEVPDELETELYLANGRLNLGKKVKNDWNDKINAVEHEFEKIEKENEIYNALKALELLEEIPIEKIFYDNEYNYDKKSEGTRVNLYNEISTFIDNAIDNYISNMHCNSVSAINSFRNHNIRIQNMLEGLGFVEYAKRVEKQKDKELNNRNEIKSREELREDSDKYINEIQIDNYTTYVTISSLLKEGQVIQQRMEKHKNALGRDSNNITNLVNNRIIKLNKLKERIIQDMNDIWDDLYEVRSAEDVEALIERINLVLQKGIEQVDKNDFDELKTNLQYILFDIHNIEETSNSRKEFIEKSTYIKEKYSEIEFDFEVLPIMEEVIRKVGHSLDEKEQKWRNINLMLGAKTRENVHKWKERTKYLPEYLSDITKKEVKNLNLEAERIIKDGKIEDVIFYFKKLDIDERKKCVDELNKLI